MDCTYKTNKYRMPLLIIMSHTALGTSFYIGFAFLEEEEEDFKWVIQQLKALYASLGLKDPAVVITDRDLGLMNALKNEYPDVYHLLCIWHINKNVLKNCKRSFAYQKDWEDFLAAWYEVVCAHTIEACAEAWSSLKATYCHDYMEEVQYLWDTWVKNYKQRFCKAWTNEILHFNICTTSYVEGGHRVLKSMLKFSTGDLLSVVDCITDLLTKQYAEYSSKRAKEKIKIAFNLPRDLMANLIGKFSPHALQKIRKQWKLVKKEQTDPEQYAMGPCTGAFTTTMGLPCSHGIGAHMEAETAEEKRLKLEDVHPHWMFHKPETSTSTNDFASDVDPDSESAYQPFYEPPPPRADESEIEDLDEVKNLFQEPSSRLSPPVMSSASEVSEEELLDINEPRVMKTKGRPKGSQNHKSLMSKKEQAAARNTNRNLSGFEHVEKDIKVKATRAKKEARAEATRAKRKATAATKGGARGRGGGRNQASSSASMPRLKRFRVTKPATATTEAMDISSDEESEDGFDILESSDDDFDVSEDGDEEARDEWMH